MPEGEIYYGPLCRACTRAKNLSYLRTKHFKGDTYQSRVHYSNGCHRARRLSLSVQLSIPFPLVRVRASVTRDPLLRCRRFSAVSVVGSPEQSRHYARALMRMCSVRNVNLTVPKVGRALSDIVGVHDLRKRGNAPRLQFRSGV